MSKNIKAISISVSIILTAFLLVLIFDHRIVSALFSGRLVYGMDLYHFYSWRVFIDKSLLSGKIPLWAPFNFGGYPFVASLQPAIFYPSTLMHLILPIKAAYNLEIIGGMLLMAFFMYLWLKGFSLSGLSILAGMLIFTLSGFTAYRIWAGHISHLRCVIWLPLVFYAVRKCLETKDRLTFFTFLFIAAWAIGFELTSGFPQFVVYTFLNLLIYVCGYIILIQKDQDVKKGFFLIFLLGFFVLALFLCQVIPTLEDFKFSSIDRSFDYASQFSLPLKGLITFILPNFFGSPLNNNYRTDLTEGYYWELQNYFSIIGLFLAFLAVWSLRRNRPYFQNKNIIMIMAIISIFSLLIALGKNTPLFGILYYLVPGIKGTRAPARILGFLSFSIATLSACGFEGFKGYLENKFKGRRALVSIILIAALGLIYSDLTCGAWNRGRSRITGLSVH
ncbi:MAG: hypothetical protein NT033_01595 [Candidatus Omnitrophica bacterium]|nr:hypothetical protein [Candidatus Omnitrophota bacterium]